MGHSSYLGVVRRGDRHALGVHVRNGWRTEIEFIASPSVTVSRVCMEPLTAQSSPVPTVSVARVLQECLQQVAEEDAAWRQTPANISRVVVPPGTTADRELELASAAATYVQMVSVGTVGPVEKLADALGVSRATARMRLSRARQEGYLESVGERRAGGRLTPKATRLLRQANWPGFGKEGD